MTDSKSEKLAIHGGNPVRTKPFGARWFFDEEDRKQVLEVVDGGWGSDSNKKIEEFENVFARIHGVKYAFSTDSGTGALHSAVAAVNPEPGDEIITTPVTDVGTVLGIMLQNAIPIFADWNPDTFNTNPADVEHRINERTKAIIAVHMYGNPCDMDSLMEIGRKYKIPVIEDCSHAHLAEYKGKLVGTIGDMGCFSIGAKLITAGGGGMFISNNETFTRQAIGFARKGSEYDEGLRNSLSPGSNYQGSRQQYSFLGDYHRMSPFMAAVGLAQIGRVERTMAARAQVAKIVDEIVADLPGFQRPKIGPGDKTSYYVYAFRINETEMGVNLDQFAEALTAEGISCMGSRTPMYKYPLFAEGRTYGQSQYPFVDEQGNRRIDYTSVHLPVIEKEYPSTGMFLMRSTDSEQDAKDIGNAIRKVALHFSRK